ncbi:MAG: plastocyanin/azurin family copper-binding protein [Hyphomicrobiales bacterium]
MPHTATSDAGVSPAFDTGMLQPGQSGSVTFNSAGTFTYFCQVHPNMHGTITVQAASTGGGATATATSAAGGTGGTGGTSPQAPSTGTGTSYGTSGGYDAAWFISGAVVLLAVAGGAVVVERHRRA